MGVAHRTSRREGQISLDPFCLTRIPFKSHVFLAWLSCVSKPKCVVLGARGRVSRHGFPCLCGLILPLKSWSWTAYTPLPPPGQLRGCLPSRHVQLSITAIPRSLRQYYQWNPPCRALIPAGLNPWCQGCSWNVCGAAARPQQHGTWWVLHKAYGHHQSIRHTVVCSHYPDLMVHQNPVLFAPGRTRQIEMRNAVVLPLHVAAY